MEVGYTQGAALGWELLPLRGALRRFYGVVLRRSSLSRSYILRPCCILLIELFNRCIMIIMVQDGVVGVAVLTHSCGADLAETYTVAPSCPVEDEGLGHVACRV